MSLLPLNYAPINFSTMQLSPFWVTYQISIVLYGNSAFGRFYAAHADSSLLRHGAFRQRCSLCPAAWKRLSVDVEDLTFPPSLCSKQQPATLKTRLEKKSALFKLGLEYTSSVTPLLSPLHIPQVNHLLPSPPLFQIPWLSLHAQHSLDFTKNPFNFSWLPTFQPGHRLPGFSYQTNQKFLHTASDAFILPSQVLLTCSLIERLSGHPRIPSSQCKGSHFKIFPNGHQNSHFLLSND